MKPDFEIGAGLLYGLLGRGSTTDERRIERALRSTWNAALEEAAGVADRERTTVIGNDEYELGRNEAAIDIAANLRALKVPHG